MFTTRASLCDARNVLMVASKLYAGMAQVICRDSVSVPSIFEKSYPILSTISLA